MNPLTLPFKLPLLPVQGLIKLAEIIRDQAEQEYHDPAAVRHELEEADRAAAAGQLSGEEVSRREAEALGRLIEPEPQASEASGADAPGEEG